MNFKKMLVGLATILIMSETAGAAIKITPEVIKDYANRANVVFTIDDVQCTIVAKMQVKGAAYALEMADKGKDVSKNFKNLSLRAMLDFPDHDMEPGEIDDNFMERWDQLRNVYKGAYIMIAHNVASMKAKGKDPKLGDITNSYEAQREFYTAEFNTCLGDKEKYPETFKLYYAMGRVADGDF